MAVRKCVSFGPFTIGEPGLLLAENNDFRNIIRKSSEGAMVDDVELIQSRLLFCVLVEQWHGLVKVCGKLIVVLVGPKMKGHHPTAARIHLRKGLFGVILAL